MPSPQPSVVVVGSLNIDYIASVEELPSPGQTVGEASLIKRFGGKGANQAVAAVRQGARVMMIGCVGDDDEGHRYEERLKREGVDVSMMSRSGKVGTGTALIAVDRQGENFIIVSPGANGQLSKERLSLAHLSKHHPSAILVQFEIPMPTICALLRWANASGIPVIVNPSPFQRGFPWGRCAVDSLIVNDGEAKLVFGLDPNHLARQVSAWRKKLLAYRIRQLIITRGARPTLCLTGVELLEIPALRVKPVDTVGAGDAFAGTFAACQAAGLGLELTIRFANCAGALTTLKPGAQEAIPTRRATQQSLRRLNTPQASRSVCINLKPVSF
jgi:ribokinase